MSAKTSNQPGRRTPLSLTGGITKGGQSHNNKGGNSGGNANGHNNNLKHDNKNQQHNKTEQHQTNSQKQQQTAEAKDNPTKMQNKPAVATSESKIPKPQQQQNADNTKSQKQGNQNDKKHPLAMDKQQQQNGVSNNNKSSGNQQQQNNKEQQQNDEDVKSNEKDNKKSEATQETPENNDKEINKTQEKSEKEEKKHKHDKKKQELKKDEEKKKEDKVELQDKKEENADTDNKPAKVPEAESIAKNNEKDKGKNIAEQAIIVEVVVPHRQEQQKKQDTPKSAPSTPKSLKESKPQTPNKPTPTKTEKTPQKCAPINREVTTCIDDFEMEPLNLESSPAKAEPKEKIAVGLAPCATSTPGKIILPKPLAKTDVQLAMQPSVTPERPRAFSQISGRRAIRSTTEYTPSKFQSNLQFRESYRRINTELDATNTSLNVTVGSEIPNNASFSFFGRGRKRERTPPQQSQSAIGELQTTEMEISPPKRARLDFFSVVSSPLSLLRNRFSKATLQSSTPVKLQQKLEENEDDIEVQNVSGVSVHEDIEKSAEEVSECGDASFAAESASDNIHIKGELEILDNVGKELSLKSADKQISDDDDIQITEIALQPMTGDPTTKNKRCNVM